MYLFNTTDIDGYTFNIVHTVKYPVANIKDFYRNKLLFKHDNDILLLVTENIDKYSSII